jgi:hypothetical protein
MIRQGVCSLLVACGILLVGPALSADDVPVIDTSTAPDLVFASEPVQVRLRANVRFPVRHPLVRRPDRRGTTEAEFKASLEPGPQENGEAVVLQDRTLLLPRAADEALALRIPLTPGHLKPDRTLVVEARSGWEASRERIHLRSASRPGGDLRAVGMHLYAENEERVTVLLQRWSPAAYRRWAVPVAVARRATFAEKTPLFLLACRGGADAGTGEQERFAILRNALQGSGRPLHLILSAGEKASPVLGLIAAFAREQPASPDAVVVLDPGLADIRFGTPVKLYARGLHALIERIESLWPRVRRHVTLVVPALPPGLMDEGRAYADAVRRVAAARHVDCLEGSDLMGAAPYGPRGERLSVTSAAAGEWARGILQHTSPTRRRRVLLAGALALALAVGIFIVVQIVTRRRLHRLVQHSCRRPESGGRELTPPRRPSGS